MIHEIACPHGLGLWHLLIDLWWMIVVFGPMSAWHLMKGSFHVRNNTKRCNATKQSQSKN